MPSTTDRFYDDCPTCGKKGAGWWVLGWHYCSSCKHVFSDSGKIVEEDV